MPLTKASVTLKGRPKKQRQQSYKQASLDFDDLVSPHIYIKHGIRQQVKSLAALMSLNAEEVYGHIIEAAFKAFDASTLRSLVLKADQNVLSEATVKQVNFDSLFPINKRED